MSSPDSNISPLTEALGIGCSVGLLHAFAETTLLGLNGLRPTPLDLAILSVTSLSVALLLAALGVVVAKTLPLAKPARTLGEPLAVRTVVWSVVAAGYFLIFVRIIFFWSGWGLGSIPYWFSAAVMILVAGAAVARKGQRALVPFCSAAVVATTVCALNLVHAEWAHEPAAPEVFMARLLIPIGVSLLALAAAVATTSREHRFEPMTRALAPLLIAGAVWSGYWISVNSDLSLAAMFRGKASEASSRPNVLLAVLDTVRADHLDLFGYERQTMPHLRRFAEQECQVANRSMTTSPWTVPSHASMFTGLYPSAHGAHFPFLVERDPDFYSYSLRADIPTLAEFLGKLGYDTAGIVANYSNLSSFGISRGFGYYDAAPGTNYFPARLLWIYRFPVGPLRNLGHLIQSASSPTIHRNSRFFSRREPSYRRAREITSEARHWLNRHGGQPFFLFLNYLDAHDPYVPVPEDDERFAKRPPGEEWFGFPLERYDAVFREQATFSPLEQDFLRAQYDAELVSLDREISRLLEFLKESEEYDNTLVIVTSDHGESFFEHGLLRHGTSLYEHQNGGFVLIKMPAGSGRVHPSPSMQAVDLFPTIAAVLGETPPAGLHGAAWGEDRDYAMSELFCKTCGNEAIEPEDFPEKFRRELIAVEIGGMKLIRSTHGDDEIYDLTKDPTEKNPVRDPNPAFLRRAEEIITQRNQRLVEGQWQDTDDKILLEKLRSLGYTK